MTLRVLGLTASLFVIAAAADAQRLANWRPYVAAGRDFQVIDRSDATRAVFVMAGFAWQRPESDAGLRAYAVFNTWNGGSRQQDPSRCDESCQYEDDLLGLGIDGTRDIADLGEGRLRPYLLTGASVFGLWEAFRRGGDCDASVTVDCAEIGARRFSMAIHGGTGFALRSGRRTVTLESRVEIRARELPGTAQVAFPIVLGIRF